MCGVTVRRESVTWCLDSEELNENFGNLLELPALDGPWLRIRGYSTSTASVDITDSRDGYILDGSKNCRASLKTRVFSNSEQVNQKSISTNRLNDNSPPAFTRDFKAGGQGQGLHLGPGGADHTGRFIFYFYH